MKVKFVTVHRNGKVLAENSDSAAGSEFSWQDETSPTIQVWQNKDQAREEMGMFGFKLGEDETREHEVEV